MLWNVKIRRSKHEKTVSMLAFWLLVSISSLCAETTAVSEVLKRAAELESQSKLDEASSLYIAWLKTNYGDSGFDEIFQRTVRLQNTTAKMKSLYDDLLLFLPAGEKRHRLLIERGYWGILTGNVEDAQKDFQDASFSMPNALDYQSLLMSAHLFFEMGRYEEALNQVQVINASDCGEGLTLRAKLLQARIFDTLGKREQVLAIVKEIVAGGKGRKDSDTLLTLFMLARNYDDAIASQIFNTLKSNFPDSPECSLAQGQSAGEFGSVGFLYNPALVFPDPRTILSPQTQGTEAQPVARVSKQEKENISIQTGSFAVKENALYMVKDLEKAGFKAVVKEKKVNEKIYYAVLLLPEQVSKNDVQTIILRLKDKGYEGFLVIND